MPKPITSAPTDGSRVTVQWRDRDGVENSSIAQYRSGTDAQDSGWWVYVDSDTMKRVSPHSWSGPAGADNEEDE